MMANVDKLKKEVDSIKNSLDRLKNNISVLSEEDKKNRTDELKKRAELTKMKIQTEITMLSMQLGEDKKREKAEAQVLLNTVNDIINLQLSILTWNTGWTTAESTWSWDNWGAKEDSDKSSFWDSWRWKALKRTGIAWGIWAWIAWISSKFKWNDDEEEEEEESESADESESSDKKKKKKKKKGKEEWSRWSNFLLKAWLATWTVIWWVEVFKHRNRVSSRVKERLWLALSFDQAIQKVESEVRNWKVDADHFGAFNSHFEWWITYDEGTKEICSYWQRTKIEKNWKKLQWMDVEFASWEELIHAANIVNFAKRRLKWRWATAKPFWKTSRWWDISFTCSARWEQEFMSASNSNEWSWILWTLWTTWWWILWWYCAWVKWAAIWAVWGWTWWYALWAYIDNTSTAGRFCETISRWKNFDEFLIYLNNQTDENWKSLWESYGEQHVDTSETPVNPVIDNWLEWTERGWILAEIENEYWEDQTWRRNLEIKRWWNESWGNPEEYIISSYGHELKLTLKWWPTRKWENIDYNKIKKIHIEKYEYIDWNKIESWWDWLDIDFPHTEEGLKEAIRVINLTNMIVEDRASKWEETCPFAYWKYKTPFALEIDTPGSWTNHIWWTTILNHSTLKSKFPTLHDDLDEFPSTQSAIWFNDSFQRKMRNQAVNDKSEWSQYIKFLHQIGKWSFRKKVW